MVHLIVYYIPSLFVNQILWKMPYFLFSFPSTRKSAPARPRLLGPRIQVPVQVYYIGCTGELQEGIFWRRLPLLRFVKTLEREAAMCYNLKKKQTATFHKIDLRN